MASGRLRGAALLLLLLPALSACGTPREAAMPAAETRTPVRLPAAEREHLRSGMRLYLESVQGVLDALAQRRRDRVAAAARKAGMASLGAVSLGTVASLPPEFTLLSLDTHEKLDALAQAATANAGVSDLLERTGAIMANCTACHSMFRLAAP
jgi:hypothetical protein